MIIGITGGTGCGKTTALNVIREMGGIVIDCDAVYHDLLKTDKALLGAIEDRFPGTVEEGSLNRKKLGSIVFSDPEALRTLNTITHSAICSAVQRLLPPPPGLAAIDAIALFESGLSELCNLTIAVVAPEALRIPRLMARDGISAEYAAARIQAQKPAAYFQENCDYVLENDGTEAQFREKCLAFFQELDIMNHNQYNKGAI